MHANVKGYLIFIVSIIIHTLISGHGRGFPIVWIMAIIYSQILFNLSKRSRCKGQKGLQGYGISNLI